MKRTRKIPVRKTGLQKRRDGRYTRQIKKRRGATMKAQDSRFKHQFLVFDRDFYFC